MKRDSKNNKNTIIQGRNLLNLCQIIHKKIFNKMKVAKIKRENFYK